MKLTARVFQRFALVVAIMLIVPMAIFPNPLGFNLARAAASNIAFEFVFYGVIAWFINRELSLVGLMKAAAGCLALRLAAGFIFAVAVTLIYDMNFEICLTLGIFSYRPAVILQIALSPVALWGIITRMKAMTAVRRPVQRSIQTQAGGTSIAISKEHGIVSESLSVDDSYSHEPARPAHRAVDQQAGTPIEAHNGFERAVRYVGEHGSTYLAAVVDNEGLLLANFKRGNNHPEHWAPLALLFQEVNKSVLRKVQLPAPERLDIVLKDRRIVVARDEQFSLIVVAERHSDDTLGIRTAQALEMIRKYMAERYGQKADLGAERVYVSGIK